MGWKGMGLSIHTLPVITVGVGFGIDFGIYLVSRTIEAYQALEGRYASDYEEGRLRAAVLDAMTTSGKAVTFTALTMIFATFFWTVSKIRFDAEMGLLLGLWMAVSWAASLTLLPVLLLTGRPDFLRRSSLHA
jgi:predicted RND superfamily exporter protein